MLGFWCSDLWISVEVQLFDYFRVSLMRIKRAHSVPGRWGNLTRWCICNFLSTMTDGLPTRVNSLPTRTNYLPTFKLSTTKAEFSTNSTDCLPINYILYHVCLRSLLYPVTQNMGMPMLPYSLTLTIDAYFGVPASLLTQSARMALRT